MAGMQKKYEEIVHTYSQPLYWYIRRLVVGHEDAQDLLQDTLVTVYRKLWQLRDPSKLKAWLYRCATNEVNHFYRRRQKELGDVPIDDYLVQTLESGTYVDYGQAEAIVLQKAILSLSPLQRQVFTLKYYDDLDYDEIAKITGSTPESLKVSYHKAKEKIRQTIEEI